MSKEYVKIGNIIVKRDIVVGVSLNKDKATVVTSTNNTFTTFFPAEEEETIRKELKDAFGLG